MRITYRTLAALINKMSEEQKDMDVTVENRDEGECFAGELLISEDDSLDENHPVIYFPATDNGRREDPEGIATDIGL